jgi:hypothetical protein
MARDADRTERWRTKAQQYRACAAACIEPGARAAYAALAESCEGIVAFFTRRRVTSLVGARPQLETGAEDGGRGQGSVGQA